MPGATPPRSPRRPAAGPRLGFERLEARETPATDILTTTFGNAAPLPQGGDVIGTSADGRYVIFQSTDTDIIQNQQNPFPGVTNVFWQDSFTGERMMVSAGRQSGGTRAGGVVPSTPGQTANAVISADGQSVAFVSTRNATFFDSFVGGGSGDFLDNGDSSADVFVWNANFARAAIPLLLDDAPLMSIEIQTQVVGNTLFGTAVGFTSQATNPAISADGRFVSFVSTRNASALDASGYAIADNADNTPDIFVTGIPVITVNNGNANIQVTFARLVTAFAQADPPNGPEFESAFGRFAGTLLVDPLGRYMSSDGQTYAFVSNLSANLVDSTAAVSPPGSQEVYTVNLIENILDDTNPPSGRDRTVTMMTSAPGLTSQSVGAVAFNVLIPRDNPNAVVFSAIVPGGNNVIVSGYTNQNGGNADLYYRSILGSDVALSGFFGFTRIGQPGPAVLISAQAGSTTAGQNGLLDLSAGGVSISADASQIAFASTSTNLVAGLTDTNGQNDVFVFNRNTGINQAASVTPFGTTTANGSSSSPRLDRDGGTIAFVSNSTNLVPLVVDRNVANDIFVRNLSQGRTALVSSAPGGSRTGNAASTAPLIGGVGGVGQVYFVSQATDLVEGFAPPPATNQAYSVAFPLVAAGAAGVVAVSGGVSGQAALATFNADGSLNIQAPVTPFPGFNGAVRVANADVNGDGTPDLIVGAGPGAGPAVKVFDGTTGALLYSFFPYESSFTGGVYVAGADLNGDGMAEIIVGAGENGGPRVRVFDGATGATLADLFVFEATFRGGVRVAAADINGDGVSDLIVGAGVGGGPRVTVFSGADLLTPALTVLADIFVFEASVRNGAYVGGGDVNFDGKADLIVGAGPGGAARVRVFDANLLLAPVAGNPGTIADFFAFPDADRDGVRVALAIVDGQAVAVAGNGGGGPQVRTFNLGTLAGPVAANQISNQFAFDETVGFDGAWVG